MNTLKLDFKYCFGIEKMKEILDFTKKNVVEIYAPNGTMKSSFADTFRALNKHESIEDRIYGDEGTADVTVDGKKIDTGNIIVVNPYNNEKCDDQGALMVNEELRKIYIKMKKDIDDHKKHLYEEVKNTLKCTNRYSFNVNEKILNDFCIDKRYEFRCLREILEHIQNGDMDFDLEDDELDYEKLINDKIIEFVKNGENSKLLDQYEKKYCELLEKSEYMHAGIIDHNNYGKIGDSLDSNGFFKVNNEIKLKSKDGNTSKIITSKKELDELIKNEQKKILDTKEIKDIFNKLSKAINKNQNTRDFNNFISNHQNLIKEYNNVDLFKQKIWIKAFSKHEELLSTLMDEYDKAIEDVEKIRDEAQSQITDWEKALNLFKDRFYVPFSIEASNQDDVILNMDMPVFRYIFDNRNRERKEVKEEQLLRVLSKGEGRAYYILNFIFTIMLAEKKGEEQLLILDDISESFDYRNKYAIIEYIKDISNITNSNGEKIFNIIVLTHNYDFYRTVASRITGRNNAYIAYKHGNEIKLEKGQYQGNVFNNYKKTVKNNNNLEKKIRVFLACIPFVRNIIELIDGSNDDYLLLTSLLHLKNNTETIKIKDVVEIYNNYWMGDNEKIEFDPCVADTTIYEKIMSEADKITDEEEIDIVNKLILSMAIRLIGEKYMITKIINETDNGEQFVNDITSVQTGVLLDKFKSELGERYEDDLRNLELIAMITPENIHVNSFMYEPILDMSVKQLYDLYQKTKKMVEGFDKDIDIAS